MESILVRPRDGRELAFLKTVLEYGRIRFEAFDAPAGEMPAAEGERHWPVLDAKLRDAHRRRAEGRAVKLDTGSLEGFLESIREA